MENSNYLFSLKVDNTELTVGGDREFVEEYMKKWLPVFKDKIADNLLPGAALAAQPVQQPVQPVRPSKMSMPDFIKLKAPKNFNDFALVVFFYLERYEGMENTGVPASQVEVILAKANGPAGDQAKEVFTALEESGFIQIMPGTEENPKYQMTFTGEQCVKQGFNE